jgi:hypothetical protein
MSSSSVRRGHDYFAHMRTSIKIFFVSLVPLFLSPKMAQRIHESYGLEPVPNFVPCVPKNVPYLDVNPSYWIVLRRILFRIEKPFLRQWFD